MLNELRNRNTSVIAGIALVVGLLVGWMFLGWVLFPVNYIDGNPTQLAAKYKSDYVQMVADSYAIDQDLGAAQRRLLGFDKPEIARILSQLKADGNAAPKAARVQRLADSLGVALTVGTPSAATPVSSTPAAATSAAVTAAPAATAVAQQPASSAQPLPLGLIIGGLGLLLILGGAGGILYFSMLRKPAGSRQAPAVTAPARTAQTAAPIVTTTRETKAAAAPVAVAPMAETQTGEPPLGHFVTTYKLGDDGYDTSFSIELPTGEFLGECGVGISDVVGEGPQKVTAFEVWLFDKNDIKTVTKVLMSDYAYNNDTIRKKLQARGDAIQAGRGQEVLLETEALRVRAVVSDMAYGSGGLPQSFFAKMTIELAPTIKSHIAA